LMDDHAKPLPKEEDSPEPASGFAGIPGGFAAAEEPPAEHDEHDHEAENREPLQLEGREVTAVLVRTVDPIFGVTLPTTINEGNQARCVLPIREITNLFTLIVDPIRSALLAITALVCLVSGISILVSIYNSMSDRKHEIAVMRALGASRGTVMTVILLESILLSVGGGMFGWLSGHAAMAVPQVSHYVEQRTGVALGFASFAPPIENLELAGIGPIIGKIPPELLLIPALILLAVIVGFLPAMAAYRTDVAKALSS